MGIFLCRYKEGKGKMEEAFVLIIKKVNAQILPDIFHFTFYPYKKWQL